MEVILKGGKKVIVDRIKHYEDNESIGLIIMHDGLPFEYKVYLIQVISY